jgi:hypothetical protein
LKDATRLAIQNRGDRDKDQAPGDAVVSLELRIRRRIRHLFETRRAYEGEKESYELAILLKDQAFERLVAPTPGVSAPRSPVLDGLVEYVDRILKTEDRLVALWTSFRAERLALYRELGTVPFDDWNAFYADLSAGPIVGGEAPGAPAHAPQSGAH